MTGQEERPIGGVNCCTTRREQDKLAKGIWPEGGALVPQYGGKILAGAGSTLERFDGKGPLPSVMLLLESPPLEQVKVWYHDPEDAHMMQLRQTARMRTVPF